MSSNNGNSNGRPGSHGGAKPRLWVVTEIYYPEQISTGYYLTAIAEGLSKEFDVSVICGQPNYAARGTKAPRSECRNDVSIHRVSSTTFDKNVIPYRLCNMFTLSMSMLIFALRKIKKADRVLVVTAPPSLPFIAAIASLMKGASYTLLIHDCYPEVLVAVGKLKRDSLISKCLEFFNKWLFKHAAKIIVVGRDMHELVKRKMNGYQVPVVTIPNWADLESVHPTPRDQNPLLQQLGIRDKFVFMYAGNIGHPTDVESIIDCAEKLLGEEKFHFVFVGSGAKANWLAREVGRRKLENVSILGQRPRAEQIEFLNACDVGLVSLVKDMWGSAMPSRTYNILAAGKPILALTDNGSELARVIEEEEVGWYVPPGDAHRLVDTITKIFNDREKLDEMGVRARNAAMLKYSRDAALKRYVSELRPM